MTSTFWVKRIMLKERMNMESSPIKTPPTPHTQLHQMEKENNC